MKSLIFFLIVMFLPISIFAKTTSVTWDYDNPPTDLAGFELRINGDNSTLINISKDVLEWSGEIVFRDDENVLDMRARDLAGQVSVWSEPCYYNPIPDEPTNVRIDIVVEIRVK